MDKDKIFPIHPTTTDGTSYIVVGDAKRDANHPFISLLSEDFSYYTNVYAEDYKTDISKVRLGDILKCYHDDDDKVLGLNIKCGDTFQARDNFFSYFNNAMDELYKLPKDKHRRFCLTKSLDILCDCIISNGNCFKESNPDVFSLDSYQGQLRRIKYCTDNLFFANNSNQTKDTLAELYTVMDKTNFIYHKARSYGDFMDNQPNRFAKPDTRPRIVQTSLDAFTKK